jgi:hypothetical protein
MMLRYRRLRAEQVTTPCCLSVRQSVDLVGDRPEPRQPILVVERNATVHLADIGGAVKIVGIREVPVEAPGQQGADGRLAGAGHTHDDEDQGQNSGTLMASTGCALFRSPSRLALSAGRNARQTPTLRQSFDL